MALNPLAALQSLAGAMKQQTQAAQYAPGMSIQQQLATRKPLNTAQAGAMSRFGQNLAPTAQGAGTALNVFGMLGGGSGFSALGNFVGNLGKMGTASRDATPSGNFSIMSAPGADYEPLPSSNMDRARRDAAMQIAALRDEANRNYTRYKTEGGNMINSLQAQYAPEYQRIERDSERNARDAVTGAASRGFFASGLSQDANLKALMAGDEAQASLRGQENAQVGSILSGIQGAGLELSDMLNSLQGRENDLAQQLAERYAQQEFDNGLAQQGIDLQRLGLQQDWDKFNTGLNWEKDQFNTTFPESVRQFDANSALNRDRLNWDMEYGGAQLGMARERARLEGLMREQEQTQQQQGVNSTWMKMLVDNINRAQLGEAGFDMWKDRESGLRTFDALLPSIEAEGADPAALKRQIEYYYASRAPKQTSVPYGGGPNPNGGSGQNPWGNSTGNPTLDELLLRYSNYGMYGL